MNVYTYLENFETIPIFIFFMEDKNVNYIYLNFLLNKYENPERNENSA